MSEAELRLELARLHGEVDSLRQELDETSSGTIALTVELEESREALAQQAQQLRQANMDLEAVNAELNAFAYSVSHDLRAPLRSVLGFASVLAEDHAGALGEDGLETLARVQAAAERMNDLITALLQLSRASRTQLERDTLDLTAISSQVVADLRDAERDRNVMVDIASHMPCTGDPHLLRVVMANLIGNAWKFTSKVKDARIEVGVDVIDGRDVYFVRDNGAGFDMKYSNRLFAPFQRLHTEEEFPGTGVGLATVRRVIRRHGGLIWTEASVGKGACFYFTLGGARPSVSARLEENV